MTLSAVGRMLRTKVSISLWHQYFVTLKLEYNEKRKYLPCYVNSILEVMNKKGVFYFAISLHTAWDVMVWCRLGAVQKCGIMI